MVSGGSPIIGSVVEDDDYPVAVRASDPDGEEVDEDWPEDLPDELSDSASEIEARLEAKVDGGGSRAPFQVAVESGYGESNANEKEAGTDHDPKLKGANGRTEKGESHRPGLKELNRTAIRNPQSAIHSESRRPGLKKPTKKQISMDWPPTPRGCEWRRSDDGLNLWLCWTEWDDGKGKRIKKSRYAGHLSDDAWRIMKEYDHEAFISIVGERLRRHGGR